MSKVSPILVEDANILIDNNQDVFAALASSNLLLTGAAGLLGAYFLDVFDTYNKRNPQTPIHVTAADNYIAALPERLAHFEGNQFIKLVRHNVVEPMKTDKKFDYIIHAASIASPIYYRQYPLETIDVNVNGTWRMLDLAKEQGSKSVLFFSSSEIYGDPDPARVPTDENYWGNVSCTGPRACYDESKRMGETICVNFYRQHKVPVKIIRPFNVFGPGQRLNDQRIIPDMMRDALKGGPLVLLSDGKPKRSFCYIRDFIEGCLRLFIFGQDGESYNVGNTEEISMRDLALMMAEIGGVEGEPLEVRFGKSEDGAYLQDNPNRRCPVLDKAKQAVGYAPKVSAREGLTRTFKSYRQIGE